MLLYEVLRGQWLLAALGGGLILLLTTVAAYLAMWRPRIEPVEGQAPPSRLKTLYLTMPVVLVLTYIGIAVFMAAYLVDLIVSPPNW